MSIEISDEIIKTSGLSEKDIALEIALMLYHKNSFNLEEAAKFANITRNEFENALISRLDNEKENINIKGYDPDNPDDVAALQQPISDEELTKTLAVLNELKKLRDEISLTWTGSTNPSEIIREERREL
jgi:predicted HTH domain antitoxin